MRLRKLLRIAKWEVTKNAGGIDRRTIGVAALAIVLIGILAPSIASQGAVLDEGLYRVSVSEDSPYYEVVESDDTFVARPPTDDVRALENGSVDLLVSGRALVPADSPKGRAAADELRSSIERYNDDQLRKEPNQTAAFPVTVVLEYREQAGVGSAIAVNANQSGTDGTGGTPTGDGTASDGGDGATDGTPSDGGDGTASDGGDRTASDGGDGTASDGGDGTAGDGGDGSDGTASDGGAGGGGIGGLGSQLSGDQTSVDSPSNIAPPFPFQSLVLAFVFIVPLNFLIQAYGSTILSERLNRRGELMLVSPVSRFDIIGGKTLPYFAGAMAIESVIAVGLTYVSQGTLGGIVSIVAILPLVLLFLAATFLGAMFARSFKELTFVTVTITVSLTSYAFVPAIFTDVNPIALISPLTIVVRDLQNQAVSAPEFFFSVTPPLLTAFVLFGLGAGLYREEDMFAQRAIPLKVLDALAGRVHKRWHVGALTAVLLPFVFVLELIAIALLFILGEISIPLVLIAVAVVEEVGKSLHVYASYAHSRFDRSLRTALIIGVISGIGFFLAEKLSVIAQLVGLPELQTGQAALQTGLIQGPSAVLLLGVSLLAPLVLHTTTAAISAVGARRNRRAYVVALSVAIVVHFLYNYTVFTVVRDLV